jgi:aspartate/methionine/tyrosine aminotransferase
MKAPNTDTHSHKIYVNKRLRGFGESIFAEMNRLAQQHKAVNLGQGAPDFDGPQFVKDAAIEAINNKSNQYAPLAGLPALTEAIAGRFKKDSGIETNPQTEITVTSGCTEAIAATLLGLLEPGDEVVVFEPSYDSYVPCICLAGATARFVALTPPDFVIDAKKLDEACNERTRAILVNTPHNPSGHACTREELNAVAEIAQKRDLIVITDEVYEHLTYEREHIRMATLPGMRNRTITLSSLGKTYSMTGWKIGWAIASPELSLAVRAAHQFLTFSAPPPLQWAAATALSCSDDYFTELRSTFNHRRNLLMEGLENVGFTVFKPHAGYFVLVDHRAFGFPSDRMFCRYMTEEVGVAAIPASALYANPEHGKNLVRFAFCKSEKTIEAALDRLHARLRRP